MFSQYIYYFTYWINICHVSCLLKTGQCFSYRVKSKLFNLIFWGHHHLTSALPSVPLSVCPQVWGSLQTTEPLIIHVLVFPYHCRSWSFLFLVLLLSKMLATCGYWTLDTWLVQTEVFCKCGKQTRFQRLSTKECKLSHAQFYIFYIDYRLKR